MKIYLLSFVAALLTLGISPAVEEECFACLGTTDSFGVYITDMAGNNVSGQVLSKQTYYRVVVDMNHPDCFKNTAYAITSLSGMTSSAMAKDATCGDVEFVVFINGVIPKGTMSWHIEITPYGDDSVTNDPCLATHHAKTLSGTAN